MAPVLPKQTIQGLLEEWTLEGAIRRHVLKIYEGTGRNKMQAARLLGVDRRTLYRMLHRYGVDK